MWSILATYPIRRALLTATLASLLSAAASAEDPLTEPQHALFRALVAGHGDDEPGAERPAENEDNLKALLIEWVAAGKTAPAGYSFAAREIALDGIPDDGKPHPVRVARDLFVLQAGDEQVFAFRRMLECMGSAASDGPMQGVPQIQCDAP